MARRWIHYMRLAGFPLGLGLMLVLVSGTLNRVMIVELDLPASLVGLFFAASLAVAPARAWLGYFSDGHPVAGRRREPYIVLGGLVAGLGVIGATLIVTNIAVVGPVLVGGTLTAFLAYALGYTLASNTFEALLADVFHGDQRPRAVTIYKVAMFAGLFGGAIALGRLLDPYDETRLVAIVVGIAALFAGLSAVAVIYQEPRQPAAGVLSRQAAEVPFGEAVRAVVLSDPQGRRFFALVVLSVLGTLAQDVLLEPYGALVLDMSVAQTTRLTAMWGAGTIIAMLASGSWLIQRTGYLAALRAGLALNVAVFAGFILAGWLGSPALFRGLVFVLGLGTGLSMAGLLTAVIEYTTSARAGLMMGVWGTAAEIGQTMGGVLGGAVVDAMRWLTGGDALIAYSTLFTLEGALLAIALALAADLRAKMPAHLADVSAGVPAGGMAGD